MLRSLRVARGFGHLRTIVIVSDNDEVPDESFAEVQEQIAVAGGYPVPAHPLEIAPQVQYPSVVIVMLPWTGEPGNIETLCLPAIRDRWPDQAVCLDEFSKCTEASEWPVNRKSKMQLRSLISAVCRPDPNTSLTYAWSRSVELIPLNHASFDRVAGFFQAL